MTTGGASGSRADELLEGRAGGPMKRILGAQIRGSGVLFAF